MSKIVTFEAEPPYLCLPRNIHEAKSIIGTEDSVRISQAYGWGPVAMIGMMREVISADCGIDLLTATRRDRHEGKAPNAQTMNFATSMVGMAFSDYAKYRARAKSLKNFTDPAKATESLADFNINHFLFGTSFQWIFTALVRGLKPDLVAGIASREDDYNHSTDLFLTEKRQRIRQRIDLTVGSNEKGLKDKLKKLDRAEFEVALCVIPTRRNSTTRFLHDLLILGDRIPKVIYGDRVHDTSEELLIDRHVASHLTTGIHIFPDILSRIYSAEMALALAEIVIRTEEIISDEALGASHRVKQKTEEVLHLLS